MGDEVIELFRATWRVLGSTQLQNIVAFFALVGVAFYVVLTHRLHRAAIRQSEGAIRPALIFQRSSADRNEIELHNVGTGPALDVAFYGYPRAGGPTGAVGLIKAGATCPVFKTSELRDGTHKWDIVASYFSLSNVRYDSSIDYDESRDLIVTRFTGGDLKAAFKDGSLEYKKFPSSRD